MLHITTEITGSKPPQGTTTKRKHSLKQHLLEKMKTWINSLLEGERDEFLGGGGTSKEGAARVCPQGRFWKTAV